MYNGLRFCFKVDFVRPNYAVERESRDAHGNWIPPTEPRAISRVASTGWRRWEANSNSFSPMPDTGEDNVHECSLFFDSERNHFLGVHFDCTKKSVQNEIRIRDERHGWRRLMFNHLEPSDNSGRPKSILEFDREHNVLAARGSPTWMPELIPDTYNYNGLQERPLGYTDLAGRLDLLIGFAAFSGPCPTSDTEAEVQRALRAIRAFRPPNWVPHHLPSGRTHGRGVIVSIRSIAGNEAVLQQYENGNYGSLIVP
ncbi:hypothetical protein AJ79_03923 [Helicocarpus griseus UAMH5409]|uniref:Uncharacterized protein n=1 Tax=Helicocarpus griseus UAMH5409 TaxID=1447875 RepID=A0A2B7XVC0_9EURO|nr:hypothetical protein AJ79_03923 [Helicocarpus griseus UAMH5409]